MNLLGQFLLNNLLPAMFAGSMAWAFVHLAVSVLGIRHGKLRLCLYLAPVVKSTMVLLGMTLVLAWPRDVFAGWAARAIQPEVVLPWFALATGVAILARTWLARRSVRQLLQGARPAPDDSRLAEALESVLGAYRSGASRIEARCRIDRLPSRPRLLLGDNDLRSPAVVAAREPTIVFPQSLVSRLDDHELQAALAHELAHVYLRRPGNCYSSETVRVVSALNPFAGLMAAQLHREEEKACDDVAVDILGDPDCYAGMLLQSYRFAASRPDGLTARLQFVPQLLGVRPMISERVEHLMARDTAGDMFRQRLAFACVWAVLLGVFFTS